MRLEAARRSLLGQDQHQPHQEQQQQQQQQPQQQRLPINRRPVNAVKSAFITRSNNPHQDSFKKSIKTNPEDAVINKKKLPDYLAFLINIVWFYPVTFVLKVTFGVNFILNIPWKVIELAKYLTNLPFVAFEKGTKSVFAICHWTSNNVQGLLQLCIDYHFGRIFAIFVILWLIPFDDIKIMTYPLFGVLRLVLGTLYPAYASYKAVRTKNVREYVKWMMYWIVFAIFSSVESFADIFIAFWFPFYYEVKILILIWLISPVSRGSLGSSILYRRFVHPALMNREEEIDHMILRLQEQGYNTVTKLAINGFNYVSNMVMQTAIRGGGGLVHQLRKSYSLTDLGTEEPDFGQDSRAIINDHADELEVLERRRRTGSTSGSGSGATTVRYVRHISHDPNSDPQMRRRRSSRSRDTPRDLDEVSSSGYSGSAVNGEYFPVSSETMDTEDYELYDPRIHGKPRLVPRTASANNPGGRTRPKQEVSHYGTLPRSYKAGRSRPGIVPNYVK